MAEFTLVGLRVVRAVTRHGSFSTAAEWLGYTQSAVSRQVALMEQAAGRPLFERHARGVVPTEAGRLVVRHAEGVFSELDAARQALGDLDGSRGGRLRVGAFSTAMAALVPDAIAAVTTADPRLHVVPREGSSASLLTALARGRLDVAVVTLPDRTPDGVSLITLVNDPLLVAVPHDHRLAGRGQVSPAELRDLRWVAGSADVRATLLGAWADSPWEPDIRFGVRDWMAKLGLVAAGLGATIVPGIAVSALPPTIAVVGIDHPRAIRSVTLATPTGTDEVAYRGLFTEALVDSAAQLSARVRRRLRE
ncbi:LysR family transcriptional regulator [Nocardia sp. NPDC005978]|uniref:LysR family transcriptional regulator n=1 Tax=Nocardia sp. NPDC005978 TaxID=3156725 RepID=UPI0033BAD4C2